MATYDGPTLARLLDLQGEDTAIKRLTERRASLPEAQRLSKVSDQLAELESDLTIAQKQHDEVAREQSRLEGEIGLIEQKIAKEEQRLFSGGVSNPKELANLQAEVASLRNKKNGVEDHLLEVMEQKEGAAETLERLMGERNAAATEAKELTGTVEGLVSDIDAELGSHGNKRAELATTLPADLLALYDKIRSAKGGVGAAALQGGTCQGCHTKIPQREVEQIRAEGGLQRCDNCRRILVI